jgi:hypothetical protein
MAKDRHSIFISDKKDGQCNKGVGIWKLNEEPLLHKKYFELTDGP